MKPLYIAAYQQSKFGKLMGMTVPEIIDTTVRKTFGSMGPTALLRPVEGPSFLIP